MKLYNKINPKVYLLICLLVICSSCSDFLTKDQEPMVAMSLDSYFLKEQLTICIFNPTLSSGSLVWVMDHLFRLPITMHLRPGRQRLTVGRIIIFAFEDVIAFLNLSTMLTLPMRRKDHV